MVPIVKHIFHQYQEFTKTDSNNIKLLDWKQSEISVQFGSEQTIDNYPHCDGEHDRWSTKWVAEHEVKLQISEK